jgi:hypothetical protein
LKDTITYSPLIGKPGLLLEGGLRNPLTNGRVHWSMFKGYSIGMVDLKNNVRAFAISG